MRTKSAASGIKRSPLLGYKTYDPDAEGFGCSSQWRSAFRYCMGMDEAKQRMGSKAKGPLGVIFGDTLPVGWTARTLSDQWAEIKKMWRKLVVDFYPEERNGEWHGNKEKYLDVQGAYTVLRAEYMRKGVLV